VTDSLRTVGGPDPSFEVRFSPARSPGQVDFAQFQVIFADEPG
jgi:hypothetical protein